MINLLGLNDTSIFYENLKQRVSERIFMSHEPIESLGLLEETPVVKLNTPLDTLSYYLSKRLAFGKTFPATVKNIIQTKLLIFHIKMTPNETSLYCDTSSLFVGPIKHVKRKALILLCTANQPPKDIRQWH